MGQRISRAKAKIKAAAHPLSGALRRGSPRAARRRPDGALPDLQRGLPGQRQQDGSGARRPHRRGDPARPAGPRAGADAEPGSGEVTGLLALMLLTEARRRHGCPRPASWSRSTSRSEAAWDRRPDRGGPPPGPRAARGGRRRRPAARPLPAARRDQRGAHRRVRGPGHRLVPGRCALRPAAPGRPVTGGRAQPGGRASPSSTGRPWRSRWSTGCRWTATTPSTPPGRSCCAGWAGSTRLASVRPGDRARRQHGRGRVPQPASWSARRPGRGYRLPVSPTSHWSNVTAPSRVPSDGRSAPFRIARPICPGSATRSTRSRRPVAAR